MKLHIATTLTILAAAAGASSQQPDPNPGGGGDGQITSTGTLLFTTSTLGWESTLSGHGELLSRLGRRDMAVITPGAGASAETFLAKANYNAVYGDKDLDLNYVDPTIGKAIDAVTVCGDAADARFPRFPDVYISVKEQIGVLGLTEVMTPGDVASPRPDGGYAFLIRESQIRTAFGISPEAPVDVDAVEQGDDGTLWLSLEDDLLIHDGAELSLDGDLLMIEPEFLTYAGCEVVQVVPGQGRIAVPESEWDLMTSRSGVANTSGVAVTLIGDLDGIAMDDTDIPWPMPGGTTSEPLPHFLFCGSTLDGAAVLTTQIGGRIAVLNGQPLASAAPMATTGVRMGLVPDSSPKVHALDGLCLLEDPPLRLVADASPAQVMGPVTVLFEWSGAEPNGKTALAVAVGIPGFGPLTPPFAVKNPGFGYWFCGSFPYWLPAIADDFGLAHFEFHYAGDIPDGIFLIVQPMAKFSGIDGVVVGGPAIVQF